MRNKTFLKCIEVYLNHSTLWEVEVKFDENLYRTKENYLYAVLLKKYE